METREAIFGRHSIRKYKPDMIPDDDLQYIIDAGLYAPSAVDYQPWYFVVIKSKEKMEELRKVMGEAARNLIPNLNSIFPKHPEVVADSVNFIGSLGGAPVCVLCFWHKTHYEKSDSSIDQSISAAIENMLLAATDRGIGSCWLTAPIEGLRADILQEMFAPEHGRLISVLTFGYSDIVPKRPRRRDGRYVII